METYIQSVLFDFLLETQQHVTARQSTLGGSSWLLWSCDRSSHLVKDWKFSFIIRTGIAAFVTLFFLFKIVDTNRHIQICHGHNFVTSFSQNSYSSSSPSSQPHSTSSPSSSFFFTSSSSNTSFSVGLTFTAIFVSLAMAPLDNPSSVMWILFVAVICSDGDGGEAWWWFDWISDFLFSFLVISTSWAFFIEIPGSRWTTE